MILQKMLFPENVHKLFVPKNIDNPVYDVNSFAWAT